MLGRGRGRGRGLAPVSQGRDIRFALGDRVLAVLVRAFVVKNVVCVSYNRGISVKWNDGMLGLTSQHSVRAHQPTASVSPCT